LVYPLDYLMRAPVPSLRVARSWSRGIGSRQWLGGGGGCVGVGGISSGVTPKGRPGWSAHRKSMLLPVRGHSRPDRPARLSRGSSTPPPSPPPLEH
jgi:hypothetical protein